MLRGRSSGGSLMNSRPRSMSNGGSSSTRSKNRVSYTPPVGKSFGGGNLVRLALDPHGTGPCEDGQEPCGANYQNNCPPCGLRRSVGQPGPTMPYNCDESGVCS